MLATPHLLTGAAIGAVTQNYYAAFILGVISHHLLDIIPHFDTAIFHMNEKDDHYQLTKRDWLIGVGDAMIGVVILLLITISMLMVVGSPYNIGPILVGALGGIFTDLFDNVPFWKERFRQTKIGKKVHAFHEYYHFQPTTKNWWWGMVGSAGVIIIDLLILLR